MHYITHSFQQLTELSKSRCSSITMSERAGVDNLEEA